MQNSSSNDAAIFMGVGLIALLVVLAVALVFWIFFCSCCKRICEKAGHEPGAMIWIPIVNVVPLLTVAGLPIWLILLLFIPLVNVVVGLLIWWKICEARGKPGPLALLLLVPVVNLFVPVYLAFSE